MNTKIAGIYQKLSDIAEDAQTAATGRPDALHDILIDLIDATQSLAVATGEAIEAQTAAKVHTTQPAAKVRAGETLTAAELGFDFWWQIEQIKDFANIEIETADETDFWKEFSPEIDLHIFVSAECQLKFECYAYQIKNGETAISREIKIFRLNPKPERVKIPATEFIKQEIK